jgi:hypothetical protein
MPVLKVADCKISISLGTKLAMKPLEEYYFQYIYRDIVRPILKKILEKAEVSCWAKWNKEKQQWEGNLNYKGKSYQWVIKEK